MTDRDKLSQLVLSALVDFGLPPTEGASGFTEDTLLFGPDGLLDSIALVSFVLDVEMAIQDEFGIGVTLADDRAMSQKRSPFRRVADLVDYAKMLLDEQSAS